MALGLDGAFLPRWKACVGTASRFADEMANEERALVVSVGLASDVPS